jgi:hypothetical protein
VTDRSRGTYFFIHVMKTGGTTFVQHIEENFQPHERYPGPERGPRRREAYAMIDQLRALSPERMAEIKVYVGHFPFVASTFVTPTPTTFTILREPVARTISVLRHAKRYQARMQDATLEQIYDDGFIFPMQIHNYQVKQFAMTPNDRLESHLDVIDIDRHRLDVARANLERVDLLGLHEHYDAFVAEVSNRFGWQCGPVTSLRVHNDHWKVSPELHARIVADNAADIAFYEYALELYGHRRADRSARPTMRSR